MANKSSRSGASQAPKRSGEASAMRDHVEHLARGGVPRESGGELSKYVGKSALEKVAKLWLVTATAETECTRDGQRSMARRSSWQNLPPVM